MMRLTAIALPLTLLLALAGCGGGGNGDEGAGTIPGLEGFTIEDELRGNPGPFQTEEFEPPLALIAPEGWRFQEDFGLVQGFRGAGEAQALTFDSSVETTDAAALVEQMRGTPDLEAGEVEQLTIAGYDAHFFEAEPLFATTVEGTEYYALGQGPVRVWVVDVDGDIVTIFAESSVLRTERREAGEVVSEFFDEVDQVLSTLEFGSAPDTGTDGETDTGTETDG